MIKALLIEDNEDNRISMTILLENDDFHVEVAINGFEGLEKAKAETPDVILLDIQLPDIDGFKVLEGLLQMESTQNIPVIAVTSSAMAGDRQQLLSVGCKGYIEKPIDPMRFTQQIKKYLGI
jgi:two-component system cell cycle response regulator DivK